MEDPDDATRVAIPAAERAECVATFPAAKGAGVPPYNTVDMRPGGVSVPPTVTRPVVRSNDAYDKSSTTGKVTPSIVGTEPVVGFIKPTSLSSFMGLSLGGDIRETVTRNKAVPTAVATTVVSWLPTTVSTMPGAWTTLLGKPPVSVSVVPPEADPGAALLRSPVPIGTLFEPILVPPVVNSVAGVVTDPVEEAPVGKWVDANTVFSDTSKDLSRALQEDAVVCPTEGPTAETPEGPSFPLTTVVPPAEPATDTNQSPVTVTVGPTDAKDVGPGTIPPVYLGATTAKIVVPGFTL